MLSLRIAYTSWILWLPDTFVHNSIDSVTTICVSNNCTQREKHSMCRFLCKRLKDAYRLHIISNTHALPHSKLLNTQYSTIDERKCLYKMTAICLLCGPFYLNKISNEELQAKHSTFTALSSVMKMAQKRPIMHLEQLNGFFLFCVQITDMWTVIFVKNVKKNWNDYYELWWPMFASNHLVTKFIKKSI